MASLDGLAFFRRVFAFSSIYIFHSASSCLLFLSYCRFGNVVSLSLILSPEISLYYHLLASSSFILLTLASPYVICHPLYLLVSSFLHFAIFLVLPTATFPLLPLASSILSTPPFLLSCYSFCNLLLVLIYSCFLLLTVPFLLLVGLDWWCVWGGGERRREGCNERVRKRRRKETRKRGRQVQK